MAAGDGVVLRAGRAGGYGNLIELRHRNGITTRYGHLRGFARGIRARRAGRAGPDDRLRRLDRPRHRARTCTTSSGSTASPRTRAGWSWATARRSATAIRDDFDRERDRLARSCSQPSAGRSRAPSHSRPPKPQTRWLP